MSHKRRFGISIPEELARDLDRLALTTGVDRSSLVVGALKEYIHDHLHYLEPHYCMGIMIISGRIEHNRLFKIIEKYHDIIHSYSHSHLGNTCLETIIVAGPSGNIAQMHKELAGNNCHVRYIPLKYSIRRENTSSNP